MVGDKFEFFSEFFTGEGEVSEGVVYVPGPNDAC